MAFCGTEGGVVEFEIWRVDRKFLRVGDIEADFEGDGFFLLEEC